MTPPMSVERALEVARLLAKSATTEFCPHEVGRENARKAAKVLEALGPFVAACVAYNDYYDRMSVIKDAGCPEFLAMTGAYRALTGALSPEEGPRT